MTAPRWLASLRNRLPKALVVTITTVCILAVSAIIGGLLITRPWVIESAALLVLTGWCGWLTWNRATLADRCDQATDTADRALAHAQQIGDELVEAPSTGRHARGRRAA